MRLLQINVTANVGSTGRIAEQIGLLAKHQGWESYIAYGRSAQSSNSNLIKVGNILDILYHGLITRLFDRHGLGSRMATKRLVKKIQRIQPDIIHLHNVHGYYLNYKILFEYLATTPIPVVWTLHDCWSFTGHCAHFVGVGCDKWKEQCRSCPLTNQYPKSFVDGSTRNYNVKKTLFNKLLGRLTIVPVSHWLEGYLEQSFLQQHNIQTIANGVDISVFRPQPSVVNQLNTKTIIGVSSVWNDSKGLGDFIKLRQLLPQTIAIKLVGLSAEQVESLPEGIVGVVRTRSVEELVDVYSGADAFVNPTYADTFPTVNLEALACGIPIITYRTGGSPEAVTSETGVVVEQGNLEELKNAIMAVLSNGKSYYSAACRKRAEEHFDKDKCFQKYIDLYKEILSKK